MPSSDPLAVATGSLRLASGLSFIVAPQAASRIWGSDPDGNPTAALLLRSMGYRDALIGGMLLRAGLRGDPSTAGWFLASGGADASDLLGSLANHDRLPRRAQTVGIAGAVVGIAMGLAGAARAARMRP